MPIVIKTDRDNKSLLIWPIKICGYVREEEKKEKERDRKRERERETHAIKRRRYDKEERGRRNRGGENAARPHAEPSHGRISFALRSFEAPRLLLLLRLLRPPPLPPRLCESGAVIFHGLRRGLIEIVSATSADYI